VVEAVVAYCGAKNTEQLTWPLKILQELLGDDDYRAEVVALLDEWDTEYSRNVEPKIQLIHALEETIGDDARETVEKFLEDVNESVQFKAVQTLFAQNNEASIPALAKLLENEDASLRVKNEVAKGLIKKGWTLAEELRKGVREALRETPYGVDASGKVVQRGGA
jgi:HEAT repeat protein